MTLTDPTSALRGPTTAFIAYSHVDKRYLARLHEHLSLLRNEGKLNDWHDRRIDPGQEWEQAIDDRLYNDKLILLLVSPSFLASKYCWEKEMTVAMQRHEAGEATVIPIIVRDCDWESAPFGKLEVLPEKGKPIARWSPQDTGWRNVAKGIRRVIDSLSPAGLTNASTSTPLTTHELDQDAEQLTQRLARIEEMTRTAHTEAVTDRLSGGSPLTKHVMRQDISRKACLVIAHLGKVQGDNNIIGIEVDLRNEGEYPAYDVKVVRDIGSGFDPEPEEAAIDVIMPRETRSAGFHVPPPKRDESNTWYPQQRTVRLKVTFRDGLARRDEAIFIIRMHNQQSIWSAKEDKQAAQYSTYCAHLKPLPAPDRRPRGLTEDEHRILEALVRRASTKRAIFSPVIFSRRAGDDTIEYQSDIVRGMEGEITDKDDQTHFYPNRDFLPSLAPTYLIRESRRTHDQYHMKRSLFEAYDFESPIT